jgi:FkbM family methyltransferase
MESGCYDSRVLFSINGLVKIWNVCPTSVLHVGAHEAEELEFYEEFQWGPVIWVEAQPDKANELVERLANSEHRVIKGAAWDVSDEILTLNIASNSQSTSLLDLGTHSVSYPDVTYVEKLEIKTIRLDQEINANEVPDFGNFDIQGAELRALRGLGNLLTNFKWIYTEVNRESVYKDCALVSELDEFLLKAGFHRVATRWVPKKGWGDALYIRSDQLPPKYKKLLGEISNVIWRFSPHKKLITDLSRAIYRRLLHI